MRAVLLALMIAGCAAAASAQTEAAPSADAVIAAERAFAADAAEHGWAGAFRRAAAPDAITLGPDPVNAHEQLAQIEGEGETTLDWRPAFAGIARSGDLGFTTGPFLFRSRDGIVGHYFTVWQRQPDGSWKWIFDAGTDVRDPGPPVAVDAEIPTLPIAESGTPDTSRALGWVRAIEMNMADLPSPNGSALAFWLAPDARVNRPGEAAVVGAGEGASLARRWGESLYFEPPVRMESSAAGDMVFSMGPVRWREVGGAERRGYYARIWQMRPDGWRVVFDEIVPRRG